MQAIILAAGMGKRLKELTRDETKCMIKVNGVTLIERMLSQLDKLDLSRIILVVGYKAESLKNYISTLSISTPILYITNDVYDQTNNIYSLFLAREYMGQEDTLLLESDLIFDDCVLRALVDDPYPSLVLLAKYEAWMDGTVVTLRDDGMIDEILDREHFRYSDTGKYYKTVNVYKFCRAFSEHRYIPFLEAYCQVLGHNEYYEIVLKVITQLNQPDLKAKVLDEGNWYEIDDVQDLDIAESIFAPDGRDRVSLVTSRYGGYWRYPRMLDFCYLVNPYFPPQRLMDEIKANFELLIKQYPSGQRVNNLLAAKYFGVSRDYIAVGNGAAELIKAAIEQIPGNIGVVFPTFEEYPNRKPAEIISYKPNNCTFSYSADDLMDFFGDRDIRALVLINPDNPSGNYLPQPDVGRLSEWASGKGIVLILDESFVDFAEPRDTMLVDTLLKKYPNTVVIKSISKAYGVPGLRLGVLAGSNKPFISAVSKSLPIWNINSFAEFYLQICEKYRNDLTDALRRFYAVRDEFMALLQSVPFLEPVPSKSNYILCRIREGRSAKEITEHLLLRHNILIKDLSGKNGIDGEYIRVAIKLPEENALLIEGLNAIKEV